MTRDEAHRCALQFLMDRAPELADDIMARVERCEITDAEAFELAPEFARTEGFNGARRIDD